jgi:hypothetical protein
MRPTDIARAFLISLLALAAVKPQQRGNNAGVKSVACTSKTGAAVDKEFCATITRQMSRYKPKLVAPNRTLAKTVIEFSAYSDETSITLASVLVTDPIGKNTVKLIFTPPVGATAAANRTLIALGEILRRQATAVNVGWITVVSPEPAGAKK